MKTEPDALGAARTSPGAQNKKMVPDALGTVENESRSAELENET
jgi:hypothetical protein